MSSSSTPCKSISYTSSLITFFESSSSLRSSKRSYQVLELENSTWSISRGSPESFVSALLMTFRFIIAVSSFESTDSSESTFSTIVGYLVFYISSAAISVLLVFLICEMGGKNEGADYGGENSSCFTSEDEPGLDVLSAFFPPLALLPNSFHYTFASC